MEDNEKYGHRRDLQSRLDELRDFAEREYPDAAIVEFVDIISGTATDEAEQYQTLRSEIAADGVDAVVVDEISRLSRLSGGEIHDFIQHEGKYDTSVRDREVGLSIDVDITTVPNQSNDAEHEALKERVDDPRASDRDGASDPHLVDLREVMEDMEGSEDLRDIDTDLPNIRESFEE